MSNNVKKSFKKWVTKVGEPDAVHRLMKRGIGLSTVDQLMSERYDHEPRGTNRVAILEEMAKDGFVLTDEAS